MKRNRRRILLAVDPAVLEGALAELLSARADDEIVQLSRHRRKGFSGQYDAAVVSADVPSGVVADVVITLPDTRGSSGRGSVRRGTTTHQVSIGGAERVLELLEQYSSSE